MNHTPARQPCTSPRLRPIITAAEIERRVAELGGQICNDYAGCDDLVIIAVMRGAIFFLVDLLRQLDRPLRLDIVHAASYRGAATTGSVQMLQPVTIDIRGSDVLVIDDILDTGLTLRRVLDHLAACRPRTLRTCVLLSKNVPRQAEVTADYIGFEIADQFVVGYGLDYNDRYRHLPYIAAVETDDAG